MTIRQILKLSPSAAPPAFRGGEDDDDNYYNPKEKFGMPPMPPPSSSTVMMVSVDDYLCCSAHNNNKAVDCRDWLLSHYSGGGNYSSTTTSPAASSLSGSSRRNSRSPVLWSVFCALVTDLMESLLTKKAVFLRSNNNNKVGSSRGKRRYPSMGLLTATGLILLVLLQFLSSQDGGGSRRVLHITDQAFSMTLATVNAARPPPAPTTIVTAWCILDEDKNTPPQQIEQESENGIANQFSSSPYIAAQTLFSCWSYFERMREHHHKQVQQEERAEQESRSLVNLLQPPPPPQQQQVSVQCGFWFRHPSLKREERLHPWTKSLIKAMGCQTTRRDPWRHNHPTEQGDKSNKPDKETKSGSSKTKTRLEHVFYDPSSINNQDGEALPWFQFPRDAVSLRRAVLSDKVIERLERHLRQGATTSSDDHDEEPKSEPNRKGLRRTGSNQEAFKDELEQAEHEQHPPHPLVKIGMIVEREAAEADPKRKMITSEDGKEILKEIETRLREELGHQIEVAHVDDSPTTLAEKTLEQQAAWWHNHTVVLMASSAEEEDGLTNMAFLPLELHHARTASLHPSQAAAAPAGVVLEISSRKESRAGPLPQPQQHHASYSALSFAHSLGIRYQVVTWRSARREVDEEAAAAPTTASQDEDEALATHMADDAHAVAAPFSKDKVVAIASQAARDLLAHWTPLHQHHAPPAEGVVVLE